MAFRFESETAVVKVNGLMGVIDKSGHILIKPEYLSVGHRCGDIMHVKIDIDEWGYVNRGGELVYRVHR
jgi:hypothetical protein